MADKTKANSCKGRCIFLFDSLYRDPCAEMMSDIAEMVYQLPSTQYNINLDKITSPYDIDPKIPVIDMFINSPGGGTNTMNSLMTFINIARNKGAIIRTTVTGQAASCASLIAIQGTPGFRIMYHQAYHVVHYGNSNIDVSAVGEIDLATEHEKTLRKYQQDTYTKFTNMTAKEVQQCMKCEHHSFFAKQCLEKNMCDWILTDTGALITRKNKQR